jgi:hypothetical protein
MSTREFILKLLIECREYLKLILPAIIAWHMPPPNWRRKKPDVDPSKPDA